MLVPILFFGQEIIFDTHQIISGGSDGYGRPRVVLTTNDAPLIVWRKDATPKTLKASKWNGSSFSSPYDILATGILPSSWDGPEVVSRGDTVYVVFTSLATSQSSIMLIKSFDGGLTFSDTIRVSENNPLHKYRMANIAINKDGHPVVSYMQYLLNWLEPKQMVNVSISFGDSFVGAIAGSNLSPGEPCDCCKSSLVCSGDDVFLLYRNNESNMRNSYISKSTDGGMSFSSFMDMDDYIWMLSSCPATTPRGALIGDSIVVVKRSGATGNNEVVYSSVSKSDLNYSYNRNIDFVNGAIQNFPEVCASGDTVFAVWQDNRTNMQDCFLSFSLSGANDLGNSVIFTDTSSFGNKVDPDVAFANNTVFLVYLNSTSHDIVFVKANLNSVTSISESAKDHKEDLLKSFDLLGRFVGHKRNNSIIGIKF